MSTIHEQELLTVKETALRLRVHEKTVRRLIHQGKLPALTVGPKKAYRIDEGELAAWVYGDAA